MSKLIINRQEKCVSKAHEKLIADVKAKKPYQTQEEMEAASKAWDKLDVGVDYFGRVITLPAEPDEMPLEKARDHLDRLIRDQNQDFAVFEIFDAYPHDAAVAFAKALKTLHGFAAFVTEHTFFGPNPPQMLSVKTGMKDTDVVQCPMGEFKLPGVTGTIKTQFWRRNPRDPVQFVVSGTIKKKFKHVLVELAVETRRILKFESIYRGKPLRIRVMDNGELDTNQPPEFLDVREIRENHLFFDDDVYDQIYTSILVPVRHTDECREHGIQAKRTVVLSGKYGTGKSLTGRLVAKEAEDNNWTFILLDKVQGLKIALEFANRYAPAIVFAEDVERIAGTERTDDVNELLNVVDGVVSKTSQVMTVLTTNHADQINVAMLRPGRLDALINIKEPGPETAARIVRYYAGNKLAIDEPLTETGRELAGQIPATIREAVDRAKLGMIGGGRDHLVDHDIAVAAKSMLEHLALLNAQATKETDAQVLERGLTAVVRSAGIDRIRQEMGIFD